MKLDSRRGVLLALLAVSIAYHGARAYLSIGALINPGAYPEAPFKLKPNSRGVASVTEAGAAAGLRAGDEVRRVGRS